MNKKQLQIGEEKHVSKFAIFPIKIGEFLIWFKYYKKIYKYDGKKWKYIGKQYSYFS
jgi:hypothetical protein